MATRCEIFCEILIAILIPPLGVCFRHGCCTVEFCICLLLTFLGYVPGIIYALFFRWAKWKKMVSKNGNEQSPFLMWINFCV
ncbi:UPF0057 membrane protein, partial [Cucurbita argyrosperma subsp. sororia]